MKVITAAAAIEAGIVGPDTMYSSDRFDKRYKSLPGDGSHKWDPQISVRKAIAKSSNIVIGKLGCDLGPKRLHAAMSRFGFGRKTGIELPGEEVGILRPWQKWDQLTWSRAPIGQGVSVTALQMASAYQAIANDGVRMPPRIVRQVLDADGNDILDPSTRIAPGGERVLSRATARTMRDMMLKVNTPEGTAQKVRDRKYVPGLYRATFCGIVPSGVFKRDPSDAEPVPARVVILVTLDFEKNVRYHQGGNSSGRIFKRIAQAAMLHLNVAPDRPDEVNSLTQDEFDRMLRESEKRYVMELDPEWDGNTDWMEQPAEHAAAAALN